MKALHIFRTGPQTPMSGGVIEFTAADLAACAAAYDPALSEAPIVVGHPRANLPAYGWVKSLAVAGGNLFAEPHQVDPAFAELVAAGRYKKISAAFYAPDAPHNPRPGGYYLRHIGFLGAQPPAVKGLREPQFAEGEEGVIEIEFSEGALAPEPADPENQPETIVTPEQAAAIQAENEQLKKELQTQQAERQREAAERRHAEHLGFAESLVTKGQLAPKDKTLVAALMDNLSAQPIEFGEGDQKQDMAAALKAFLIERPASVAFGEHATRARATSGLSEDALHEYAERPVDTDRLQLHARARALAAEKNIPYADAIRQAIRAAQ